MKKYEVIHVHDRTFFPAYEDAIEFAKKSTQPVDDDDLNVYVEYNKALIIIEEEKIVNNLTFKMVFVQLLEFMHKNTWTITDLLI